MVVILAIRRARSTMSLRREDSFTSRSFLLLDPRVARHRTSVSARSPSCLSRKRRKSERDHASESTRSVESSSRVNVRNVGVAKEVIRVSPSLVPLVFVCGGYDGVPNVDIARSRALHRDLYVEQDVPKLVSTKPRERLQSLLDCLRQVFILASAQGVSWVTTSKCVVRTLRCFGSQRGFPRHVRG